ncbi:class I SAM-dependent methyltransferase [Galbibacter sp. EGI 63066]|uniref:class I SAM-dependent methyltransferase n=1 Tax=Galbibacter sp. EGI 63066 TaxID=2993559 RepID=UPI0022494E73|nr:class I SAM-dependent methyltransferase [Galbibacter sp. EGI 63066]MCX2680056.1 class I SAM-dependent methyltransferase [Galbibacter sp. EGI 63066]
MKNKKDKITEMSEKELKELASQLGKPEGDKGIKIAQMMNESNISMTRKTLEHLSLEDNDKILELGHGNANHLTEIFNKASDLQYFGLDISELMKQEAENFSIEHHFNQKSTFQLYDGTNIPFSDHSFDKIFTVNTLYFWEKPNDLLNELKRVLKPNGILCITFVDKETMNRLPFTDYGFTKYDQNTFSKLIEKSELKLTGTKLYTEIIKSKSGEEMERKYWVMTLSKSTKN